MSVRSVGGCCCCCPLPHPTPLQSLQGRIRRIRRTATITTTTTTRRRGRVLPHRTPNLRKPRGARGCQTRRMGHPRHTQRPGRSVPQWKRRRSRGCVFFFPVRKEASTPPYLAKRKGCRHGFSVVFGGLFWSILLGIGSMISLARLVRWNYQKVRPLAPLVSVANGRPLLPLTPQNSYLRRHERHRTAARAIPTAIPTQGRSHF